MLKWSGILSSGETVWLADRGTQSGDLHITTPSVAYQMPVVLGGPGFSFGTFNAALRTPIASGAASVTVNLFKNGGIVATVVLDNTTPVGTGITVAFGPVTYGHDDFISVQAIGTGDTLPTDTGLTATVGPP